MLIFGQILIIRNGLWSVFYFIGDNKGKDSYLDMYLMSKCKHNIIANSTFSWWSAWLNANSDKVVISPSRYYGDDPMIRCCDNQIILQY